MLHDILAIEFGFVSIFSVIVSLVFFVLFFYFFKSKRDLSANENDRLERLRDEHNQILNKISELESRLNSDNIS